MKRGIGWWLVACGACVPAWALAAGTATVQTGDRTLTVSFDGDSARVDISGIPQGYLLMRDGKLYTIMQAGGRSLVLDGDAVAGLLGGRKLKFGPDMIRSLTRLKSTGTRETVAGHAGVVYTVSYQDEQGRARSGQGVLGAQPETQELTRALGKMAVLMRQTAGQVPASQSPDGAREVLEALQSRGLGVLRYEQQFRVEQLSATPPAPGSLELPAAPNQLPPELGQLLKGLTQP